MSKLIPVKDLKSYRFINNAAHSKGVILKYNSFGNTSEIWKNGELLATGVIGRRYVDSSSLSSASEDAEYTVYSIVSGTGDPVGSTTTSKAISSSTLSASYAYGFFYGLVTSNGVSIDKGLRVNLSVANLSGGGAVSKSVWMATYGGNGLWVQWGYGWHKSFGDRMVFQTWRNGVQVFDKATLLVPFIPQVTVGTSPLYALTYTGANNLWRASRDGVDYWEVDLETDTCGALEMAIETGQASRAGKFPSINFTNIKTKQVDTWTTPATGTISQASYGINGHLQNASIANGDIKMGGNLKIVPYGTQIW